MGQTERPIRKESVYSYCQELIGDKELWRIKYWWIRLIVLDSSLAVPAKECRKKEGDERSNESWCVVDRLQLLTICFTQLAQEVALFHSNLSLCLLDMNNRNKFTSCIRNMRDHDAPCSRWRPSVDSFCWYVDRRLGRIRDRSLIHVILVLTSTLRMFGHQLKGFSLF